MISLNVSFFLHSQSENLLYHANVLGMLLIYFKLLNGPNYKESAEIFLGSSKRGSIFTTLTYHHEDNIRDMYQTMCSIVIVVVSTPPPPAVGVKIRNLKVNFKTGGTWRRAMNTDNENV